MAIQAGEAKPPGGRLSRQNVSLGIVRPMANETGSAARFVGEALAACGECAEDAAAASE
jgi:hypothetical protein